ncbi:hypothetical protein FQR65_LT09112 [Abscondita terminalis]|nr:hypothetical protein FQR65_LT09112 [Abscondita terminalis]
MSESESTESDTKKRRTEDELFKIFRKSKKVGRSPEKEEVKEEYKKSKKKECGKKDEDEIKNLCMEMLKEIKAIKINQEKTNEEMKEIRLEIKQMNEKWENKCKKLEERVDSLEKKTEILEKEKRRTNLVIKGLDVCVKTRKRLIGRWSLNMEREVD